jgi:hypothetical protein
MANIAYVSLPMRERGLKCIDDCYGYYVPESLPMRERGLKSAFGREVVKIERVAPHAGAWIEILSNGFSASKISSLPMRERGLKYFAGIRLPAGL